jgi:hypothetical protein
LCLAALAMSFIWPYRKPIWNVVARISLALGLAACSSRAVAGAAVIALLIVLLLRKNLVTALWVTVTAALIFLVVSTINLEGIAAGADATSHRAQSFARLAHGEAAGVVKDDIRWRIWQYSAGVALDNWATGCGLTCMDRVAPFAGNGLGPHNIYIYLMGTGGFMPLLAFLFLLGSALKWSLELRDPKQRSVSVALVASFAFLMFFDHATILMQALSPLMLFFATLGAETSG